MSKMLTVAKHEYVQVVKKKSFVVGLILTPLLMAGFMVIPALLATQQASEAQKMAVLDASGQQIGEKFIESLDDYTLPDSDDPYYNVVGLFEVADDEERYRQVYDSLANMIVQKDIRFFVVVRPGAYYYDDSVFTVSNAEDFRSINRFEHKLETILSSRRLEMADINIGIDSVLALTRDLDMTVKDVKGEAMPFEIKYFASLIFVMILFAMIIGYGQLTMRSVIEEKNSRIMEVLVSSVTPMQLMLGKLFGLLGAAATQTGIWVGAGLILFMFRGAFALDISIERIIFNPLIVATFVVMLLGGYLLFSTLFALIGSIVNTEQEAQSMVAPITMILILPVVGAIGVVQDPNSSIAFWLSMIPFLAPTLMLMRVVFIAPSVTDYSLFSGILGETILSSVILILTIAFIIWLTAKIFRIGILMYGKRPTLPEIVKWVRY